MSQFSRSRGMHQFYRDVFTRIIYLPETDALPAHIVAEIMTFKSADIARLEPMIREAQTELDADKDVALKNMLCALTMANLALDGKQQGRQVAYPAELSERVTQNIVEALKLDDNLNYLVAAIQILFRINEINSALFLISNNLSLVSESAPVLKILLLICLMEEDYNQAQVVIQALTADSTLIGEDQMTLLMIVCGICKLGGLPETFIDFRPLVDASHTPDYSRYTWLIEKQHREKTTVLVACDKGYYFEHALTLIYSVYETNRDTLDVHLHIYNCDDELHQHVQALARALPELHISLTHETVETQPGLNVHYASRRFIFLRHALEAFETPVLALDADCLVRRGWVDVHAEADNARFILTSNENAPLWEQVLGGFVYAQPDAVTLRYFDIVARFIDENLRAQNVRWFLDQVALSFALDYLPPVEQLAVQRVPSCHLIEFDQGFENPFSWVVTTVKNADGGYQQYKQELQQRYGALLENALATA
ncbi:hypothetical protein [Vagococcus sp. WN89Y]|uniref:hypothetical protein n=1 Tax=Vagococcus sp. WN89Y TaxID=3457258 RepID=UPI003FCD3332